MLVEILENIDWMFSGIGVVVGIALLNFFRKVRFTAPAKAINFLAEFISSLLRSSEDISKNIEIDLRPRHDPFELWLHDLPKCQTWLRVINLNPFPLDLKDISLEFNFGGMSAKARSEYHDQKVGKSTICDGVLVEGDLTGEQADYIAKYEDNPQCRITIRATFKAQSKEVKYENSWLEGVRVKLVNDQARKAKFLAD